MIADVIYAYAIIAITGLVICVGLIYIEKIHHYLSIKGRIRRQERDHIRDHRR